MRGLLPRNLKYIRAFAAVWKDPEIVQQVAAQIPWFHISYSKQSIRLSLDIPLTPCYPPHHGAQGCAPNVSYHEIARRHYRQECPGLRISRKFDFPETCPNSGVTDSRRRWLMITMKLFISSPPIDTQSEVVLV